MRKNLEHREINLTQSTVAASSTWFTQQIFNYSHPVFVKMFFDKKFNEKIIFNYFWEAEGGFCVNASSPVPACFCVWSF